jgi:hypothetical protein
VTRSGTTVSRRPTFQPAGDRFPAPIGRRTHDQGQNAVRYESQGPSALDGVYGPE